MKHVMSGLLAGVVATAMLPVGPAAAQAAPRKLSNPGAYTIHSDLDLAGAAGALASAMGGSANRRTVDWILDHANRALAPLCGTGSGGALAPLATGGTGEFGFCWSMTDPTSAAWIPQGITTTGDALGTRLYDNRQAVVTTWYNDAENSTRISIAPASGYSAGANYRHVLLVAPESGATFTTVSCHAGGAMWYGHLLYVACTDHIKIFDWNNVYSADTTAACADHVGKVIDGALGTRFCASGYAYLMMQVGSITNPSGNVRFSSISLDRASTPDRLVVSEYSTSAGATLERFDLDFQTRLPSGTSAADVYELPFTLVQGATTRGDKFWFHSSGGVIQNGETPADNYGKLRFWNPTTGRFVTYTSAYGAEAISYWPWDDGDGGMPDLLYTLTEHAGYRAVIAVRQADFN